MAYLRLAPYAVIAALVFLVMWYRADIAGARAALAASETQLGEAREANRTNLEAIGRLTALRAAEDALLQSLNARLGELQAGSEQVRSNVARLERSNAAVRDYLAGRVPDDLRRMLNRGAGGANAR